jgi:Meiotically Up-regulated Gene 113 (MUG113) protein
VSAAREARVYAMVCPKAGAIKIGMSVRPMDRLSSLSTPSWLFLWETWEGGRAEERRAHEVLREHRIRREWFTAHPDVIAFIAEQAGCTEMAEAIRSDFRVAGALMQRACSWAALHDETEDYEDDGLHQHGAVTIAGDMLGWPATPARDDVLVPGLRWGPGPLVPEQWTNDVGSEYWVLRNPIIGRRTRGSGPTLESLQLELLP